MNTLREIACALARIKSAVIFTHMRPDGDTIGSALALHRALSLSGIESQVVNEGEIPEKFLFFPPARAILRAPTLDAEAYICVDASDEERLGELKKTFLKGARKGKLTFNLDHHVSNPRYCGYNFVREKASNCENIAELIAEMGVEQDGEIATALLMGMVTDSGGFTHGDVDGDTLRAAARAVDAGADLQKITYEVFKKQSKARSALYAEVISRLRYFLDDRLAVALVTAAQLRQYGLKQHDTEGIVDFALTVDPVEVSLCLLEVKEGQYKVSFRSKGKADVNRIAATFGGGGHVLASGCMVFGEQEEAIDRLRYAVSQYLE